MTMTRVAEIIQKWTGWCPNAYRLEAKNSGDTGIGFSDTNPLSKSPGQPGANGPKPWGKLYEHTQRGFVLVGTITVIFILLLSSLVLVGIDGIEKAAVIVLGILFVVMAICSTLTVSVSDVDLRIRFGPVGLIRKSWPLEGIVSVTTVKNPWYYGYGLRYTPTGPLYNVWGRGAVEIMQHSGKTFRIGTDEPDHLKRAIEQALKNYK